MPQSQGQPVTGADGQPFKPATKKDDKQQEIAAQLLAATLPPGATPQETAAAVQQASQAAAALASGSPMATGKKPTLDELRAVNPGVSEDELKAYYKNQYGE